MPLNDLGILGGGQLAGMLVAAATKLGLTSAVCAEAPVPAAALARVVPLNPETLSGVRALAETSRVITCESETIPAGLLLAIEESTQVRPSPAIQSIAQDRWQEKRYLRAQGIPTADFCMINSSVDIVSGAQVLGYPCLLKTRHGGYDGRGQSWVTSPDAAQDAWESIGGRPAVLEARVPFDYECSQIGVRAADGSMAFYPLVQTHHQSGILGWAVAGVPDRHVAEDAQRLMASLLTSLNYVGILTLEMFVVGGRLIANEIAPRVHNSGHWTIEGCATSQFENHVRAVCGLPLGSTALKQPTAMVNCIGDLPDLDALSAIPGAKLHYYGKQPRPGRKVGHITITAPDPQILKTRLQQVRNLVDHHVAVAAGKG